MRVLVVADRCTDGTTDVAQGHGAEVLIKDFAKWNHPYAETLEQGLRSVIGEADYVAVVDGDIVVPSKLFERAITTLEQEPSVVYVTPRLITEPSIWFNRLYRLYELLIAPVRLTPGVRGGCRVYRASALQQVQDGDLLLQDVAAPDSYLDLMLKGRRVILRDQHALHIRQTSLRRSIQGQIRAGYARRQLGVSFGRTLLHSIFRLRFFVLYGYLHGPRGMIRDES